jgi:hypothetical protein
MSCPLNAKRFAGSGYVKCAETTQSKETEERMAKLLADRNAQDNKYFPTTSSASPIEPVKQTNQITFARPKPVT